MLVELLTGLSCSDAREFIDDTLYEEMPEEMQQKANKSKNCCSWSPEQVHALSKIAADCTRAQSKHRTTVAAVLPQLELIAAGALIASR
jgi:hypothetical protein